MHDLTIVNGTLIDGTGSAGVRADLAVDCDRIVAIGGDVGSATRTIDAEGRIVTPGFVDVHTHLDAQIKWDPFGTPTCWHGVITVLLGNCGVTFAPVRPEHHEDVARMLESVEEIPTASSMAALTWNWERYGDYLNDLEGTPKGVNIAGLIGHAATRYYAMGPDSIDPERHPSDDELAVMIELVDEAIGAGALGFSTRARPARPPSGAQLACRSTPGSLALGHRGGLRALQTAEDRQPRLESTESSIFSKPATPGGPLTRGKDSRDPRVASSVA